MIGGSNNDGVKAAYEYLKDTASRESTGGNADGVRYVG